MLESHSPPRPLPSWQYSVENGNLRGHKHLYIWGMWMVQMSQVHFQLGWNELWIIIILQVLKKSNKVSINIHCAGIRGIHFKYSILLREGRGTVLEQILNFLTSPHKRQWLLSVSFQNKIGQNIFFQWFGCCDLYKSLPIQVCPILAVFSGGRTGLSMRNREAKSLPNET